jgi:hypothetical protein
MKGRVESMEEEMCASDGRMEHGLRTERMGRGRGRKKGEVGRGSYGPMKSVDIGFGSRYTKVR